MTITDSELQRRRPISDEDRVEIDNLKRAMRLQTQLRELRERRGISQQHVADELGTSRPNVSRIEASDDLRFTTLDRYAHALGGRLEVRVVFTDETVDLA